MERLASAIDALFRPRDNYTTTARTIALLGAALLLYWAERALDEDMNPWLIALVVAGLLNLCALFLNLLRTLNERPFVVLKEAREQLIQATANLSARRNSNPSPDVTIAAAESIARAHSLLGQEGISCPRPMDVGATTLLSEVFDLIRVCDDRIADLKNRPGCFRRAVALLLGASQKGEGR